VISLRMHNILDYVFGVFLLFVPAILGFEAVTAARNLFVLSGLGLIGYSLLTRYQYSFWGLIPLGLHMTLETVLGIILILAPWVLGYRELLTGGQEIAHYIIGIGAIGLVAITRSKTEAEKRAQEPTYPGRFSPSGRF
jgi:uncharacterized membrane protein HdeD (DUF308 family)